MKFCYIDESGTGSEPFAVMVGVLVDAHRMRPTKADWDGLLLNLSRIAGRHIEELHTRDFYAGNSPWRELSGEQRSEIVDAVLTWLAKRKHSILYSSLDKSLWYEQFPSDARYAEVNTLWRFLGFHLVLAIQRHTQRERRNKGNTVLILDNEERERIRFTDLLLSPPAWSDTYYDRRRNQEQLDQIVDTPYFADSRDVPLLQLADFLAFFLRRHAELEAGNAERYDGERAKVAGWARAALARTVSQAAIYPKRSRCQCADMFFNYAPVCLR